MTERDDDALLLAWGEGDAAAGQQLVRRHAPAVLRFLQRRIPSHAEDLTQRAFLVAVEVRHRIRNAASFRAFLFGIARNLLLKHMERDRPYEEWSEGGSPLESPSLAAARHEEQSLLLTALRQLPVDLQLTIELFYWEGMSTTELAHVLGVPSGTIKWRLSAARERLRDLIAETPVSPALRTSTLRGFDGWIESMRARVGAPGDHKRG
jgi:RNA polymerase sigma factor (sigma-70 family)